MRLIRPRLAVLAFAFVLPMVVAGPARAAPVGTIAFVAQPKARVARSLFLVAALGTEAHRISRAADAVEHFAWSPNGARLAYSAAGPRGRSSVVVEHADGRHAVALSEQCRSPCPLAWSPDGGSLAIGGAQQLRVVRLAGARGRTVSRIAGRISSLAWSPAGTMIAFRTAAGALELVTLGAGRAELMSAGVTTGPAWSPDGTMVLFVAQGTLYSLAVGVAGAQPRALTPASSAAFSPDGARIAFANGSGLSLMNADGSGQVLVRAGRIAAPDWSTDGLELAYVRAGRLTVGDLVGSPDASTRLRSLPQVAWRPARPLAHPLLPAYSTATFQAPSPLGAPSGYALSASGDFNDDGLQDVVIARQAKSPDTPNGTTGTPMPLGVLEADGKGHLVDASASVFGGVAPGVIEPKTLVVADFNEDGQPDIFIGSDGFSYPAGLGRNRLFLSTGDGHLVDATANLPLDQGFAFTTSTADVNHDGHLDLFVNYPFSNGAPPPEIWLGDGLGHFTAESAGLPSAVASTAQSFSSSAFADLNGDGAPDLVLGAFGQTSSSVVVLNDGTGHFTTELSLPPKAVGPSAEATAIQPIDLDRDGHIDLLVGYAAENTDGTVQAPLLQVLMGNGDGTFRDETATRFPQTASQLPTSYGSMQLLDVDGDGILDVGVHLIGPSPRQGTFLLVKNGTLVEQIFPPFAAGGLSEWQPIDVDGTGGRDLFQAYADPDQAFSTEQHPVYFQSGNPLPAAPPMGLRAWKTAGGSVRLSWPYSWGAVAYQIWRSTPGAPPRWIATSHRTHIDDATAPSGVAVTYTVRAVNAAGASSDSPAVTLTR